MTKQTLRALLLPTVLASAAARAHDGHGLPAPAHWHASDSVGFVVLAVAAGLLWWARRK